MEIRISNLDDSKIPMGVDVTNQRAQGFNPVEQTGDTNKRTVTMRYLASYVKADGDIQASAITTYVGFSVVYPKQAARTMRRVPTHLSAPQTTSNILASIVILALEPVSA